MKRVLPLFWLLVIATVPLWLRDQYFLHVTITTAIFIIAAMSLNLLLGYTGQLSLGHVAFFGIGAYASALTRWDSMSSCRAVLPSCIRRGRRLSVLSWP